MQKVNTVCSTLLIALLPGVILLFVHSLKPINVQAATPVSIQVPEPAPAPSPNTESIRQRTVIRDWFKKYNCPLTKYTDEFIDASEQTGLDFRLLPAISFRESTCGKRQLGFNPFGFGYYIFESFTDAITYVSQAISGTGTKDAKHYKGAKKDAYQILRVYNKDPEYASRVVKTMNQIEEKRLGE